MTHATPAAPPSADAPTPSAWSLVNLELETRFEIAPDERIEREAPPDGGPGPLMFLAGCADGVVARIGRSVRDDIAQELRALSANEPPMVGPDSAPRGLDRYLALLGRDGPAAAHAGLAFHLPHGTAAPGEAVTIMSGTDEAARLENRLARDGMPPALLALKIREVADLWPPYCLVMRDGEIASLAFAARLGDHGAELGLETLPAYRGRGLAALAVAAWSAHPALADRTLFYSTARSNLASQRVAAKLGLGFIGPTWTISRA
jgi:GNAT acetyltransferase